MNDVAASAIDNAPLSRFQAEIVALCAFVAALDGFDTQVIAYVAPSIVEDWTIDQGALGSVFASGLFGLTIGALTLSQAGDQYGRKRVIVLCTVVFGVFAALTARADGLFELIALRFITGLGLGGAMPNLIALTNEYSPKRLNATLVAIMFCGFPLGSTIGGFLSAPLITEYGWRSVFVVGGTVPLLLLPLLIIRLPESARFLATTEGGRLKLAQIMRKIAPDVPVDQQLAELATKTETGPHRLSVGALFEPQRAVMTLLLWVAFFMSLLVMYFLVNWLPSLLRAGGMPLGTAIASTALLNLGGVVGAIILSRGIDQRSPTVTLSLAYLAAAVVICVIATVGSNSALILAGATLIGFGIVGGQISLNAVAAASYPSEMRSTGVGWALGVGRLGSIFGPLAGGVMLTRGWTGSELILASALPALIAAVAIYWLRSFLPMSCR